jgi:intracellular septation protein A
VPVDDERPDPSAEREQQLSDSAEREEPLSLRAQLREAVARAGIAQVAPGEAPSGRALLTAVGGARGLAESILPGFAFLVVYAITHELVPSVVIPVVVALVFVGVRLVQRQSLATSLVGILGVAISAGLALITGRAESNFIPGIVINAVSLVVLLVTLAIRRPLIGVVVGLLLPDGEDWRADAAKRRVLTVATWLWAGLFAVRLVIEIPLYLTAQVELLAGIKLITGVPLYAALLWVTWLLCRSAVFSGAARSGAPEDQV